MSLNLLKIGVELDKTNSHVTLEEHQEALMALDVSGYEDYVRSKYPFGTNDAIFKFDSWERLQGLNYLVGIESWTVDFDTGITKIRTLDHQKFSSPDDDLVISYFMENLSKIGAVWGSGNHSPSNPPIYYINWAKSKDIEIPWLSYVKSHNLIPIAPSPQMEEISMTPKSMPPNKSDKPLNARLENNYLRLILSLCYGLRGFEPSARPTTIAKLIIDATGIDISQETLAGYIEKAKALENQERD